MPREPKVGVVGGVGPAATVDFMAKLIAATPASRDQDHMKMVVEHNPQIPDRTEALLGRGEDPTAALQAACAVLVRAGATMIAIPCNTAHAFLGRIQPHVPVPILDMPAETAKRIRAESGAGARVGVLATEGTIASGLYQRALEHHGLVPLTPDAEHQRLVTQAIYGQRGIKAGHTVGECAVSLTAAASHLAARGAAAIILGCTELPLAIRERAYAGPGGRDIPYVDPTETLARACLALAGRDVNANSTS